MTRYKKWLIGSLVISAVSIALVTGLTFNSETVEALRRIKLEYILAAALLHISSYFIWGLRTRAFCKSLGYRINILKMTEIVISTGCLKTQTISTIGLWAMSTLNSDRVFFRNSNIN